MKDGIRRVIFLLPILLSACSNPGAGGPGDGAPGEGGVPTFAVDPGWPREMPNLWIMGSITGVFVDARDHVWVTHIPESLTPEETSAVQDPPIGTCCVPAPVVTEFDPEGNLVQGWGDPATQDVSEFTRSGDLVMTIGRYDENAGSDAPELLGGPASVWVDPEDNEVFVADGYQNRRVVVFDGEIGAYLRHRGAYGEPPDDAYEYDYVGWTPGSAPPRQFSTVHDLIGSNDSLIYVADRRGNRIQG